MVDGAKSKNGKSLLLSSSFESRRAFSPSCLHRPTQIMTEPKTPAELATAFNKLAVKAPIDVPWKSTIPNSKAPISTSNNVGENRFQFSIRLVEMDPKSLVLCLLHPITPHLHIEALPLPPNLKISNQTLEQSLDSNLNILGLPIALCLLKGFLTKLGSQSEIPPFAPREWVMADNERDQKIAREVEKALGILNVSPRLRKVGKATKVSA